MAPPNPHRSSIMHLFKARVAPVDIIKKLGVPSRTVYDSISRFKKLGTFLDRYRIKAVKERIRRYPLRSIRKMAKDMKISQSLMERMLKDKLKLTCYHEDDWPEDWKENEYIRTCMRAGPTGFLDFHAAANQMSRAECRTKAPIPRAPFKLSASPQCAVACMRRNQRTLPKFWRRFTSLQRESTLFLDDVAFCASKGVEPLEFFFKIIGHFYENNKRNHFCRDTLLQGSDQYFTHFANIKCVKSRLKFEIKSDGRFFTKAEPGAPSERGQFLNYNPRTKKLCGTVDSVEISFRQLLEKYKNPFKDIELYAAIFKTAHVPVNTENGKMTILTRDFINNFSSRISEMPPMFIDELLKCVRANAGPTLPLAFAGNMLFYMTIEAETKQDFTFFRQLTSSRGRALQDVACLLNRSLAKVKELAKDFPPCYHHKYVFPFSAMDALIDIVDDPSIKDDANKYQELIRSVGYIYTPSDVS
ncbi:unnamed protein product [Caenorhabditis auriculariae]|uniref:Uncharacterized protein n=1 Tax=Caenorhabditis auriculariae TaxID=2777116 RepID=A0A8S1H3F5_9PELO|nr:unnamed protein product [Caenorhabditis auriculariae]